MDVTNPDVPKELHKDVKKHGMDQDLKVPKAYQEVLKPGLAVTKELENQFQNQIEELAEQNNTTKSETINNLVKKGLKEVKK